MFTFRYHVASLAAVFLALAVGIVLGVAISGRVSKAETTLKDDEIARLNSELQSVRAQASATKKQGFAASQLLVNAYPALMTDMLKNKRFALVFLGPSDGNLESAVGRTLEDADAGADPRMLALDVPVDPKSLDGFLRGHPPLASYAAGGADFTSLGDELGSELVAGQSTIWSQVATKLVRERSGSTTGALDGVVVVASWQAPTGTGSSEQTTGTETLLAGVVKGLRDSGVPVVGVEALGTRPSVVGLYRTDGLSSVDDIDTLAGRLALATLLAGGDPGHYGLKKTASDGVAPPIAPVLSTTTSAS